MSSSLFNALREIESKIKVLRPGIHPVQVYGAEVPGGMFHTILGNPVRRIYLYHPNHPEDMHPCEFDPLDCPNLERDVIRLANSLRDTETIFCRLCGETRFSITLTGGKFFLKCENYSCGIIRELVGSTISVIEPKPINFKGSRRIRVKGKKE